MIAALAFLLAIAPHAMRAHVNFLASDAVEGREAGTRGYDVAAAYVAAQFEAMGAEPAGDGGTYLQQVRFRTFLLDPAQSSFAIDGKTFELPSEHENQPIQPAEPFPLLDLERHPIRICGLGRGQDDEVFRLAQRPFDRRPGLRPDAEITFVEKDAECPPPIPPLRVSL